MITITVTSLNAKPMAEPPAARFGEAGGTIGRAPENTLVLLDPDRKISRMHATIVFRDGAYALRDHGSVTPVILNGQPIGNGREQPLSGGDEIRIGPYVLAVAAAAPDVAESAQEAAPEPERDEAAPASLSEPVVSWESAVPAAPPGEGITTVILHGAEGEHAAAGSASAATSAPTAGAAQAPLAAPASGTTASATSTAAAAKPSVATAASGASPAASAAASAATAAASAATAAASAPASTEELLRALLTGAGLRGVEIPGGLTPELMRKLGQVLNEATRGLLDLLAARASTKRDVRADLTVIVAADNNPLKFSPDLEAALTHLLVPKGRGFMPPLRALADAYEDLRTHQVGFMAGMRSALAVVLARFDPQGLEERMSERSITDSFLPGTRKAKLWDQFTQLHGQIASAAESDFHTLFGAEFLKAYRAHAVKVPAAADPPPKR